MAERHEVGLLTKRIYKVSSFGGLPRSLLLKRGEGERSCVFFTLCLIADDRVGSSEDCPDDCANLVSARFLSNGAYRARYDPSMSADRTRKPLGVTKRNTVPVNIKRYGDFEMFHPRAFFGEIFVVSVSNSASSNDDMNIFSQTMSSTSLSVGVVLVGPPFMISDATGPLDFFAIAAQYLGLGPDEAVDPSKQALTVHWIGKNTELFEAWGIGIKIAPTCTFDTAPKLDVLFIPGPFPDYVASTDLAAYVRRAAAETPIVMSVCSGSLVLAQMGILDGKRASTNAEVIDLARKMYPKVQ
jgi:putative intracellular protease/amidase